MVLEYLSPVSLTSARLGTGVRTGTGGYLQVHTGGNGEGKVKATPPRESKGVVSGLTVLVPWA